MNPLLLEMLAAGRVREMLAEAAGRRGTRLAGPGACPAPQVPAPQPRCPRAA